LRLAAGEGREQQQIPFGDDSKGKGKSKSDGNGVISID
jgi:hypothetical protein